MRKLQPREQLARQLTEIAVRHARNVIHYGLIFIILPCIGAIVVGKLPLNARNVMLKDIRRLVAFVYILQATVIELFERLAQLRFGVALDAALAIDLLVVLALSAADFLEQVLAHLDARLAIAVLDDIDRGMRENPAVVCSAKPIVKSVG